MSDEFEFLALEIKDGGKVILRTLEDAITWFTSEQSAWAWLRKPPASKPAAVGAASFRQRETFLRSVDQAVANFQSYKTNPSDENPLKAGRTAANNYANSGLVSSTALAKFIFQLREEVEGAVVASAALSSFLGEEAVIGTQEIQYRFPSQLGRAAISGFILGFNKKGAKALAASLDELWQSNRRTLDEERTINRNMLSQLQAAADVSSANQQAWTNRQTEDLHTELSAFNEQRDKIVKDCEDAHARYHKWMETAAGNTYWTEEHDARKKSAALWGRVLTTYTVLAVFGLAVALYEAYRYAVAENGPVYAQTHLVVSGAIILTVTILFWIARFLTRMYLSERHMAIDANLRSVMVKTYLALSTDEKLREQDRALVLAPLFRAGTDGIIKEDTGMDSVLSLVARALEKPAKS
jgi:hypothetical protein